VSCLSTTITTADFNARAQRPHRRSLDTSPPAPEGPATAEAAAGVAAPLEATPPPLKIASAGASAMFLAASIVTASSAVRSANKPVRTLPDSRRPPTSSAHLRVLDMHSLSSVEFSSVADGHVQRASSHFLSATLTRLRSSSSPFAYGASSSLRIPLGTASANATLTLAAPSNVPSTPAA
jgi:hypothetical protein